jgi:hypothetical protein
LEKGTPPPPRNLIAQALLLVMCTRGLLDTALTLAVAVGWLGGQVSGVFVLSM